MPLEPVKIPQNVYIEDRIVGPLTLRQIILIALGGGFSYVLYSMLLKTYGQLNWAVTAIVWIPLAVAAAFALVKINDLSLFRICLLVIERVSKPQARVFSPRSGIEINIKLAASTSPARGAAKNGASDVHARRIHELSSIVDRSVAGSEVDDVPLDQYEAASARTSPTPEDPPAEKLPVNPTRIAVEGSEPFRDLSPTP